MCEKKSEYRHRDRSRGNRGIEKEMHNESFWKLCPVFMMTNRTEISQKLTL